MSGAELKYSFSRINETTVMSDQSRRVLGTVFGLLMGLVYGLVSEYINRIALPGVPLYYVGLGPVMTILLAALAGGLLGLLSAWPDESIPGIILGALGGAALSTLAAWYALQLETADLSRTVGAYTVLLISFFPRAFLFAPVAWLLRRVVKLWEEELSDVHYSVRKLALSLGLLLVLAIAAGWASLYPKDARYALTRTNELIQAGLQASSQSQVPEELQPVDGFLQDAHGRYTLLLSDNPDILPVQRPMTSYSVQEYAVFANFESGFRFGCAYTPPHAKLSCGETER